MNIIRQNNLFTVMIKAVLPFQKKMDVKEVVEETLPPKFIYMERKMKENKLKWYIADKEYVNYLRQFDEKVENIDYNTKLKPYIGILITINEFNYSYQK